MRLCLLALCQSCVLAVAACTDATNASPPNAVAVSATSPAVGATAVETGAPVRVVFNQPMDPTTLTAATFTVAVGGHALPLAIGYDAATYALQGVAPLLPESTYDVTVTTGVRSAAGTGLNSAAEWTFTTRRWETVTVDTMGAIGHAVSLGLDGSGRVHVGFYDDVHGDARGDLEYATCAAACTTAGNWQVVTVDTAGAGVQASLAAEKSGRVDIAYSDEPHGDLKYATCAAGCATAANWQTVAIDTAGTVGSAVSLAVDAGGRLHVSYSGLTAGLRYATCGAACTVAANWDTVTVEAGSDMYPTSLVVDATGRVHIAYHDFDNEYLKYATCAAACATTAGWSTVTVDPPGLSDIGASPSVAVDGTGRVHITYSDGPNRALKYATCAAGCATGANWQKADVDLGGSAGVGGVTSLVVDDFGRLHVAYTDNSGGMRYGTCAAACTVAANWRNVLVDVGDVGEFASPGVDRGGRIHVAYQDNANQALKYAE